MPWFVRSLFALMFSAPTLDCIWGYKNGSFMWGVSNEKKCDFVSIRAIKISLLPQTWASLWGWPRSGGCKSSKAHSVWQTSYSGASVSDSLPCRGLRKPGVRGTSVPDFPGPCVLTSWSFSLSAYSAFWCNLGFLKNPVSFPFSNSHLTWSLFLLGMEYV